MLAGWRSKKRLALVALALAGPWLIGLQTLQARAAAPATPAPMYTYATMPDGTQIAVVVTFPAGYQATKRYPALFEMDGYDGGGGALDPSEWSNRYVMVHASVRGTGCSSGQFDLFSWKDSDDGAQLVEAWIPSRRWSDGRVGIIGHSYPGLTGFMTAERIGYDLSKGEFGGLSKSGAPKASPLKAVALSGLIDNLYSGITYMGGVPDLGFPLAWAGADRPAAELSGNFGRAESSTTAGSPACLDAYSQHELSATPLEPDLTPVADNPITNGATDMTDGPWWEAHSLETYLSYLGDTAAPVHMDQQYQDEQTGPRGGARLFQQLVSEEPSFRVNLPYRIVFTNGRHDSAGPVFHQDEQNWLDCYVAVQQGACTALGQPNANPASWTNSGHRDQTYASPSTVNPCPGESVLLYFETTGNFETTGVTDGTHVNPPICASAFPIPATRWTRYFLTGSGAAGLSPGPAGSQAYVSGANGPDDYPGPTETPVDAPASQLYTSAAGPVLSSSGPNQLSYTSAPFPTQTTLEGPIEADLWYSTTAPDTDLFVQLIDVSPNGAEQFLQYGMLRASFQAISANQSDCVSIRLGSPAACGSPGSEMYWPYHPYDNAALLTPGQIYQANVEVFPLGWVFRPGHRLVIQIASPPALDQLYSWSASARPPGVTTIYSEAAHPSSLLLPFLAVTPRLPGAAPACGAQEGVRCTTPAAG